MATDSKTYITAFDSYTINRKIGEGGSGRVFEAMDSNGAVVAIKTLDYRQLTKERLKRFKNETHFCLRNQHKNLITVVIITDNVDPNPQGSLTGQPGFRFVRRFKLKISWILLRGT